jgi:hypothetical protein
MGQYRTAPSAPRDHHRGYGRLRERSYRRLLLQTTSGSSSRRTRLALLYCWEHAVAECPTCATEYPGTSNRLPVYLNQAVDGDSERPGDVSQSLERGILANSALDLCEIWLGQPSSVRQHALSKVSSLAKSLHRFPKIRSPSRASYFSSHYAEAMGRVIARGARLRGEGMRG